MGQSRSRRLPSTLDSPSRGRLANQLETIVRNRVIQLSLEYPFDSRNHGLYGSRVALAKHLPFYLQELVEAGYVPETFLRSEEYDRFITALFDKDRDVYAVHTDVKEDIWLRWKFVEVIN